MNRPRVSRRLHADVVHVGRIVRAIENSPPGIQAMPSGAGAGAAFAFAAVGSNDDSALDALAAPPATSSGR